jgi:methylated-DNA-[protein]-cysteine S-methyltransferase
MPLIRSIGNVPGLGQVAAIASDRGLVSIEYHAWNGQVPMRHRRDAIEQGQHPVIEALWRHLESYIFGRCRDFPIACDLNGLPPMHRAALEAVRNVPYGETKNYAALANRIPNATAVVVRDALARNPVPIVIPCHRAIDGAHLGAFNGPISTKRSLLGIEGAAIAGLPDPPGLTNRMIH